MSDEQPQRGEHGAPPDGAQDAEPERRDDLPVITVSGSLTAARPGVRFE